MLGSPLEGKGTVRQRRPNEHMTTQLAPRMAALAAVIATIVAAPNAARAQGGGNLNRGVLMSGGAGPAT